MKKLIIDRTKWMRGTNGNGSALFNPKNEKMCCLGFYAISCGLSEKQIAHKAFPSSLEYHLPDNMKWLLGRNENNECIENSLATINDWYGTTEQEREEELMQEFAKHNVEVTFIN